MPRSLDRAEDEKDSLEDGLALKKPQHVAFPRPTNLHGVGLLIYVTFVASGVAASGVIGSWQGV